MRSKLFFVMAEVALRLLPILMTAFYALVGDEKAVSEAADVFLVYSVSILLIGCGAHNKVFAEYTRTGDVEGYLRFYLKNGVFLMTAGILAYFFGLKALSLSLDLFILCGVAAFFHVVFLNELYLDHASGLILRYYRCLIIYVVTVLFSTLLFYFLFYEAAGSRVFGLILSSALLVLYLPRRESIRQAGGYSQLPLLLHLGVSSYFLRELLIGILSPEAYASLVFYGQLFSIYGFAAYIVNRLLLKSLYRQLEYGRRALFFKAFLWHCVCGCGVILLLHYLAEYILIGKYAVYYVEDNTVSILLGVWFFLQGITMFLYGVLVFFDLGVKDLAIFFLLFLMYPLAGIWGDFWREQGYVSILLYYIVVGFFSILSFVVMILVKGRAYGK